MSPKSNVNKFASLTSVTSPTVNNSFHKIISEKERINLESYGSRLATDHDESNAGRKDSQMNFEFMMNTSLDRKLKKNHTNKVHLPILPRLRHMNKLTNADVDSMRYLESQGVHFPKDMLRDPNNPGHLLVDEFRAKSI